MPHMLDTEQHMEQTQIPNAPQARHPYTLTPDLSLHPSALPSMWARHSVPGCPGWVSQPSGSVPSWNLSREAQCVIFKQKESSSLTAGRKSRVCGWLGGSGGRQL